MRLGAGWGSWFTVFSCFLLGFFSRFDAGLDAWFSGQAFWTSMINGKSSAELMYLDGNEQQNRIGLLRDHLRD